ncbi:hypothetical protein ACTJJ7_16245 [Phyllobacterium sp. 22229]|uniref:hypothetical protein n=1 Tax=Phyllobacterium sp. 22229 TaxID=3453895 RepID=UPI003F83F467
MGDPNIDTSFYPQANSNSLIQTLGQVQGIRNAQQQNELLQTENQRAKVGLTNDQVNLAHQQYGKLSQFLGSLAQDPRIASPQGHDILVGATQQAIQQGWITPDIAKIEIANMPSDPAQLPQYLQNLNVRVQDGQSQFAKIYGEPGTINTGNRIIPVKSSPIMGVQRIGADIPLETSPGQRAGIVLGTDQYGRTTAQTQGQVMERAGVNPLLAVPQTAPNSPANQLMPSQPQNGIPTRVQPEQASNGAAIMSPPAGQIEAQQVMAKTNAEKYSADQQREANFQSEVLPLTKSITALQKLGTTGTGPGTEQLNEMKSFAQSMGLGAIAGIDPDKISNFDEARKYLTSYASSVGGNGTNDKLAAAFAGNPSVNISNAAAVDVAKTALATRKMQNAQNRAFTASGQPAANYGKWTSEFNAQQDPVAYGIDLMEPAARTKYFQSLSAPDKAKFINSVTTATKLGLVTPPSAPQNGG